MPPNPSASATMAAVASGGIVEPHLCARQKNISQLACCQFVLLLNDTIRLPLCDSEFMAAAENLATLSDLIFGKPQRNNNNNNNNSDTNETLAATYLLRPNNNIYTTPVYLNFPSEVPEDHITFLFGIVLLISMAICCTVFILKLTKPKFTAVPSTIGTNFDNSLNYDMMMFLPHSQRRSSVLFFLRGITCRSSVNDRSSRQTSLSVVSNSSLSVLPSYRTATTTCSTTVSPTSLPPPPYEELQRLTTTDTNNNIRRII